MENEFFLNAGIAPLLHFEPSNQMPNWQSVSGPLEIQPMELNCSSERSPDYGFYNHTWEKSTAEQSMQFDSALSSMVSSPVASNSNVSNESFVIRELIGKLGNIGNLGEISPHSQPFLPTGSSVPAPSGPYIAGNNSANTSCYSTPLNSPPKMSLEKIPSLGKSMAMNSTIAEFSADPGFAERAARFSCFGSRSFNGRTTQLGLNNNSDQFKSSRSNNPLTGNVKLSRVSSSPSLKALGSQKNSTPLIQDRTGFAANSQDETTVSEQNPNGETGLRPSNELNSRKRKASSKGKSKEPSSTSSPSTKVHLHPKMSIIQFCLTSLF